MSTADQDGTRPTVLVVDDDPDLRALAEMQLAPGFEVLLASNGRQAVEMAVSRGPDVILLDNMMPGMNGQEVLRVLSEEPATRDIPVIFLSALSAVDDRIEGLEKGAVDYISKPVEPRELIARVSAAARTSARQDALRAARPPGALDALPDRRAFEARLGEEVARSARSNAPVSILIIDVDNMTEINEGLGQGASDEVLFEISSSLRVMLRLSDVLFRYGGDEFAILLPDTDVSTAYLVAERCRDAIRQVERQGRPVSVSAGVAEFSSGRTAEELRAKAEIALFRAKESGGNQTWRADDPRRHSLSPVALSEDLTEREWDVLAHLAHRRTEPDIARRLGIRPGTVRSHKARIRRKLHVAQNQRLSDFARENFKDLVDRLEQSEQRAREAAVEDRRRSR